MTKHYILDELYTLLLLNIGYQQTIQFKRTVDALIEERVLAVNSANLSPELLESTLAAYRPQERSNIKVILPIHFGGQACEMEQILSIANHYDLQIIEDAAHAIPTSSHGKMIGALGNMTVFSFYVTKPIATGEGGMITTSSEEMVQRMKTMRLHGISRDIWDRYRTKKPNWYYEVVEPEFKYNMSDISD